jgi:hypothetical protein
MWLKPIHFLPLNPLPEEVVWKFNFKEENSPLPKASLWENPSLKKRGTLKIVSFHPFSLKRRGRGMSSNACYMILTQPLNDEVSGLVLLE